MTTNLNVQYTYTDSLNIYIYIYIYIVIQYETYLVSILLPYSYTYIVSILLYIFNNQDQQIYLIYMAMATEAGEPSGASKQTFCGSEVPEISNFVWPRNGRETIGD